MTEFSLTIDFDSNISVSDIIAQDTLDTKILKQDAPGSKVRDFVNASEAQDQREAELIAIEDFIAKNGVTRPTEENFKPKKASWGGKSKAQKLAENPDYVERRGRPRSQYIKAVTFVKVGNTWKRASRGRGKLGEIRKTFNIHFSNMDKASKGNHSLKSLQAMEKQSIK